MKIVVLEGSPNKKGSTHILADCFRQGAEEAGHTVELLNVAHADIHPCTGCIHCGYEGPCVQKDDVGSIREKILGADMMVFATPLYYYGIDLLYQHRADPKVPVEVVVETISRLMEEGKVLHWGMSEVSIRTIRKAHTMLPLTAIQNEYSIWYRDVETELLSVLEELGIGLVCFCPLGRGYLTGNLKQSNFTSKDVRIGMPRFSSEAALKANQGLLTLLQQQAEKKGCTMAQLALAWILSRRPWIVPIPGTTKLSRLEENIGAANVEFEPQELDELNSKLDQIQIYGERYNAQQESLVER